jgi:hypothetical protein
MSIVNMHLALDYFLPNNKQNKTKVLQTKQKNTTKGERKERHKK